MDEQLNKDIQDLSIMISKIINRSWTYNHTWCAFDPDENFAESWNAMIEETDLSKKIRYFDFLEWSISTTWYEHKYVVIAQVRAIKWQLRRKLGQVPKPAKKVEDTQATPSSSESLGWRMSILGATEARYSFQHRPHFHLPLMFGMILWQPLQGLSGRVNG